MIPHLQNPNFEGRTFKNEQNPYVPNRSDKSPTTINLTNCTIALVTSNRKRG